MKTKFQWNKPIKQITQEATGGNRTLLFMASEAKRLMDPYVPARNMVLARNVRTYVEGDHGIVHYISPHARFNHSGARHPLATAEWDKAMKAARMEGYSQAIQRYVNGGR